MRKSKFVFDRQQDLCNFPQGQALAYATTDCDGYRHWKSDPAIGLHCTLLATCTASAKAERIITRHIEKIALVLARN